MLLLTWALLVLVCTQTQSLTGVGDDFVRSAGDWNYEQHGEDWSGVCKSGEKQSPINLKVKLPERGTTYEQWKFQNYDKKGQMDIVNNGHTLKFTFKDEENRLVYSGGLPSTTGFQFHSLHLHFPAEHIFGMDRPVMEMHMVHFNLDRGRDLNEAVASKKSDALAVLGVWFKESENGGYFDTVSEQISKAMTSIQNRDGKAEIEKQLSLFDFIDKNITDKQLFRYEGSLTTPLCNEAVVWTVFEVKAAILDKHMKDIRDKVHSDGGKTPMDGNYRNAMRVHERIVVKAEATAQAPTAASEKATKIHEAFSIKLALGLLVTKEMLKIHF